MLQSVGQSLLGGLIGFGIMFLLYQVGALVARYRARKMQAAGQADDEEEALGGGDVFLLGVLGLMTGPVVVSILFYGVLLGGLVSLLLIIALLVRRRYSNAALMTFIPYGHKYTEAAIVKICTSQVRRFLLLPHVRHARSIK